MNAPAQALAPVATLTDIVEYSKTAAALAELREKYQGVVFQVAIPAEMQQARKARMELRTLRTDLEKMRMELNEDDQARIKARNAEAKRITAVITGIEDPIDELIKAEETRRERERAEKEAAEVKRVADIHAEISTVASIAQHCVGLRSDEIKEKLEHLRARAWTTDVAEFKATADDTKARAITSLELLYEGTKKREDDAHAEAQKIAAERAELQRLRAAQEERDRDEQARLMETRRIEAEAQAKIEAEQRAHRERLEAEERAARQKRVEADHAAQEAREAEAIKQRAEWAARDAAAAEERELRETEARKLQEERDRLDAERRDVERQQAELLDGAPMLKKFVERFGKRREFAAVTKAITEYLGRTQ